MDTSIRNKATVPASAGVDEWVKRVAEELGTIIRGRQAANKAVVDRHAERGTTVNITASELAAAVAEGVRQALSGGQPRVSEQQARENMQKFWESASVANVAAKAPAQPMDKLAKVGEAKAKPQASTTFDVARNGRDTRDNGVVAKTWAEAQVAQERQRQLDTAKAFADAAGRLSDAGRAAMGLDVPPRR